MQDGDRVSIAPILPYSDKTVYLQGHVYRPGTYAFKEGMKITDLIHSYQEVLPEPSNHAEIIRMQPPDFRPQTIEVDLASALAGDETIALQQFDTVWIFGRYEIDAPKVTIYGEVLRPGEYPMSSGMTAAALVKMAGGFRRGAYTEVADLASYEMQNGVRSGNQPTDDQDWRGGGRRCFGRCAPQARRYAHHSADSRMERHWTVGHRQRRSQVSRKLWNQ